MNIEQVREKFKGAYIARYEKAKKNLDDEYMDHTNTGEALVCQKLNMLTVSDYDKWYGIYYLMEDPDTREIMLVTLCHGDILEGVDHEYYPDAVIEFCKENNIFVDAISFLCINKSLLLYNEDKLQKHLASLHNAKDIVKSNIESKSYTYYLDGKYDSCIGYFKGPMIHKV